MHEFQMCTENPSSNPSVPLLFEFVTYVLRHVGQTFTSVGADDPRLNNVGKIDFRIQRQLKSYSKEDPPPNRVKPIPVSVLRHVMTIAFATNDPRQHAIADMICLAFYYLLRPGEYTATPSDTTPFTLADISLRIGAQHINIATATDVQLQIATFASYEFTTQKNAVCGEVIAQGRSGNLLLCPVLATVHRVAHLRQHNAPPNQPLATYYHNGNWQNVTPADITSALRMAILCLGPQNLGFMPSDISARSLCAAGAMALLCAHVDTDIIRLLGRWRSDEMLRYLHVQAKPVMRHFASRMLNHGNFVLHPNHEVPVI